MTLSCVRTEQPSRKTFATSVVNSGGSFETLIDATTSTRPSGVQQRQKLRTLKKSYPLASVSQRRDEAFTGHDRNNGDVVSCVGSKQSVV